jgi:single-stranded-DNA-specific exonuclease
MLEKHWQIAQTISPEAETNLAKFPPILRQVLFNRGYAEAESANHYLAALLSTDNDPFLMLGMEAAVDRLQSAVQHRQPIVIYGDYDADGVTATALLVETLQALGAEVSGYIPDRFDEGYGLNTAALHQLKEGGAAVVVTVDCGIRSVAEAEEAQRLGLDLIISDHHNPGPETPPALAILNSKQADCPYPDKQLAGVGTAFKLAAALADRMQPADWGVERVLDLAALGTVADLVPLIGENRWMVREGLARIRRPQRQGLMALIGVSGLTPARVNAGDIGYVLGPRLNAAGRLDSALEAYRLLLSTDIFEAGKLAQDLDNRNRERQRMTREMAEIALELAGAEDSQKRLLVAVHPEFNSGVVGLVASRLVEQAYRPAVVGQIGEEYTRASCRSIAEFHITDALQLCADLLEKFGGHAAAAGFTVRNDRLPELLERLEAIAEEQLGGLELHPTLHADGEVKLADLRADLLHQLELLEPTGYGNPNVSFVSRGLQVQSGRTVGKDSSHLKLTVTDGRVTFDAIAFRLGHWAQTLPKAVDLLYRFEANEFNGQQRLQLNVRDLRPSN